MAWETRNGKGRYYTRSRRSRGRVVRQYLGTGEVAETIAALDALEREERARSRRTVQQLRQEQAERDALVRQITDAAALWSRIALVAAGYHQHNRGAWRRRRGQF